MQIPETEVVVSGPGGGELLRAVLIPGEYVLGRNSECELRFEADLVSRRHAMLTINFDHALIEDLGSSNRTFVNGQAIKECTRLWPNQKIQIGAATVELRRMKALLMPDVSLAPTTAAVRRILPEEFLRERKYDIGGVVARGGMGAILDAKEATIERKVAMKVMLDGYSSGDLTRFIGEAKITGQLEHPNIVPVHELGVDENDQVFYTMKFVRGITLRKILELMAAGTEATIRKYPLPALLTIFQKVCDAVAFAHSKSVIHRDLKPENFMLGDFGEVLVMDWGLAKLLRRGDEENTSTGETLRSVVRPVPMEESHFSGTLDGSIMGTPQYMAPEQARGEVDALDARTDIYALGAILFHLLYLRAPVSGRTVGEIVDKVAKGCLDWPDAKASAAKKLSYLPSGRVPDSLLAVCRKALTLDPAERYQSVAGFQKDIAAYQAGFATGAEQAGFGKHLVLLIKRHKAAFSTAAAAWLVITALAVWFVIGITHERNRVNETLGKLRGTAPTFFAQAQALIDKQQFAEALEKIDYAVELNPAGAEYHYVKGNILEDLSLIAEARQAYAEALRLNPTHAFARENLNLCVEILNEEKGHTGLSKTSVKKLNLLMRKEGRSAEAIATVRILGKDRQALYDTWKSVFAKAGWREDRLIVDNDGLFEVNLHNQKIDDISILHGMPVKSLDLNTTNVSNLMPLEGAPLRSLELSSITVLTDLSPLRGMKLTDLSLRDTKVIDLSPLRGMNLTDLNLRDTKVTDLSPLQGMPLERLYLTDAKGITDLSPLRGMPLKYLDMNGTSVADIRPLQGMPLSHLSIMTEVISDISVLKGMPLIELFTTSHIRNSDLALLKGMPLEILSLSGANGASISDLRPLQGMPLKALGLQGKRITDLSPLARMKLNRIDIRDQPVTDLSPLRGQPIDEAVIDRIPATDFSAVATWPLNRAFSAKATKFRDLRLLAGKAIQRLELEGTPISDISPLRGMAIRFLDIWGTQVTDLHPLANLPNLEELVIPAEATDIEFLRRLPNIQRLGNHQSGRDSQPRPAADFWKEYDAQHAGKPCQTLWEQE